MDHPLGEAGNHRPDAAPPGRRGVDHADVPDAGQRELEGARDGGRGHGQDVHIVLEALQPLLVAHPEAVLLVDDQQAQLVEQDVAEQQAVGTDHDVHLAVVEDP